jgi:Zn-dependent protease
MVNESANPRPITALLCPSCGGDVAANLLNCPSCHRLVHADRLKELAGLAEAAERDREPSTALASWQEAISLLPTESRQHAIITGRISRLGRQVEAGPAAKTAAPKVASGKPHASPGDPPTASRWSGGVISGVVGTALLAVWKFKVVAVLLLTKGKFVLLGLTKASTFWSMLAFFGVYWTVFGGWFALGLVLSIYIHEMGHVTVLMRYGLKASAPLFIPGLGAVIRLKQGFTDPRQDARVGLAGPIWGLGAAAGCAAVYALSHQPIWAALASVGALINLFNLLPIWQLDGGRAFRSLTRPHRWLAVAAIATAWAVIPDERLNMLLLALMVVGAVRTTVEKPADESDPRILIQYVALVAALSALSLLPVPILARG